MIGIFDSGLGGLTALKELRSLLHNEDIIYLVIRGACRTVRARVKQL